MPHKHTRRGQDKYTVDLPPTVIAKPLPVSKSANANNDIFTSKLTASSNSKPKQNKRKRKDVDDDTPKAFTRLMAFKNGKKLPKGLDDGMIRAQKAKKARGGEEGPEISSAENNKSKNQNQSSRQVSGPTIKPGESMSEFSARVDAALPISGLTAKRGKDPLGLAPVRTRKEKKMHRMYDEWRMVDQKIKAQREEELELAAEREAEEELDLGGGVSWKMGMELAEMNGKKKKGKGGKKKAFGEVDDGDDDPWAAVARARAEGEGPRRLNDVVQAPPQLKAPKEKFKIRGARVDIENVPKASGSLRKREELSEVRRSVVQGYREIMKRNQGKL